MHVVFGGTRYGMSSLHSFKQRELIRWQHTSNTKSKFVISDMQRNQKAVPIDDYKRRVLNRAARTSGKPSVRNRPRQTLLQSLL